MDDTETPDVSQECLNNIKKRTLEVEDNHLHQKEARNIVPKIKEIIEEEVSNS